MIQGLRDFGERIRETVGGDSVKEGARAARSWLTPVRRDEDPNHPILRGAVAIGAIMALVLASGAALAGMATLVTALLFAWLVLTKVMGIRLDVDLPVAPS